MRGQPAEPAPVFLNIPYDAKFGRLCLAYFVGLTELGLKPKATLTIPGGTSRLERIMDLLHSCEYSIHDLSRVERVEVDRTHPRKPRFNMPFELGLAVSWAKHNPAKHTWFVFESKERRAQKSLSDLNGTDLNIHDGTVVGVMRELCNAFVRTGIRSSVPRMMLSYRRVRRLRPAMMERTGSSSILQARAFEEICLLALAFKEEP